MPQGRPHAQGVQGGAPGQAVAADVKDRHQEGQDDAAVKDQAPFPQGEDFQGVGDEGAQIQQNVDQTRAHQGRQDNVKTEVEKFSGGYAQASGFPAGHEDGAQKAQGQEEAIGKNLDRPDFKQDWMHQRFSRLG